VPQFWVQTLQLITGWQKLIIGGIKWDIPPESTTSLAYTTSCRKQIRDGVALARIGIGWRFVRSPTASWQWRKVIFIVYERSGCEGGKHKGNDILPPKQAFTTSLAILHTSWPREFIWTMRWVFQKDVWTNKSRGRTLSQTSKSTEQLACWLRSRSWLSANAKPERRKRNVSTAGYDIRGSEWRFWRNW
jgi:hypothetical protein